MNKTLPIVALVGGLVVGATLLRDAIPSSQAQQATPTQSAPATPSSAPSNAQTFNEGRALLENEQNSVNVIQQNQDGVVFVTVSSTPDVAQEGGSDPFSEFFGRGQGLPDFEQQPRQGSGSGFIVNEAGYILTNYHVVEGADTITVKLHADKKEYPAKVVGTAPDFDLALIRADTLPKNDIQPMRLGDSDAVQPGRKVIAMGAPFGLDFTATEGIVSAVDRQIPTGQRGVPQSAIQTDAAINPGNSGGPLVNSRGEVIGINTQIFTRGVAQSAGVGFAIPINTAKRLLPRLERGGQVSTPTLGVSIGDLGELTANQRRQLGSNLPEEGIFVRQVTPGSPAATAGLRAGDVLLSVDGQRIAELNNLRTYLFNKNFGDTVRVQIRRDGQTQTLSVTLREFNTTPTR